MKRSAAQDRREGHIVIFGATSGIARAVSRELLSQGAVLVLVGRDEAALQAEADDLAVRFERECRVFVWDLLERGEDGDEHARRFANLKTLGPIDGLFMAPGILASEKEGERNNGLGPTLTRRMFDLNLTETVVVLNLFAEYLGARRAGFLSVLSSVAGDRGRAGLMTYSATKAGLTAYLEGLRAALQGTGVLVQTVKPGPVKTPMTAAYKGPALLLAEPEAVARVIVEGIARRRTTVYVPGYWRLVMAVIRMLPEFLARKVPG